MNENIDMPSIWKGILASVFIFIVLMIAYWLVSTGSFTAFAAFIAVCGGYVIAIIAASKNVDKSYDEEVRKMRGW